MGLARLFFPPSFGLVALLPLAASHWEHERLRHGGLASDKPFRSSIPCQCHIICSGRDADADRYWMVGVP